MVPELFAALPSIPTITQLPKADIHVHQEGIPRLHILAMRQQGLSPFDWREVCRRLMSETGRGIPRLAGIFEPDTALNLGSLSDADDEIFISRIAMLLAESAADGAVLVEVRFGAKDILLRPHFMTLFREAEKRVQSQYPHFVAEAIGWINPVNDPGWLEQEGTRFDACLRAARDGLAGIDFRVDPYDTEADPEIWSLTYRWAEWARDAGLGITIHVAEFSPANLLAALKVPGLTRLGHATYAASDPALLEAVAESSLTVECSLTCNVVLGAVRSYREHPIRRFVEAGIPVTLNTDLPVHIATSIGREYAIAAALGFSNDELLGFTRNAVSASFAAPERRAALLAAL